MTGLGRIVGARTDSLPVALARALFGVAALFEATLVQPVLLRLAEPQVLLTPFLSMAPRPGPGLAHATVIIWVLAAIGFLFGWRTRLCGAVLTLVLGFVLLLDQQLYSNHLYLMVILGFLLTLTDAGASLSLDAARAGARSDIPEWPVTLIRLQISLVYGFSAVAKLNPEYLSGGTLLLDISRGALGLPEALRHVEIMASLALATIAAEVYVAIGLWSSRLRASAIALGVALHAGILILLVPPPGLAVFAIVMFAGYVVFPGVISRSPGPATA